MPIIYEDTTPPDYVAAVRSINPANPDNFPFLDSEDNEKMERFRQHTRDYMKNNHPEVGYVGVGAEAIVVKDPQSERRVLVYEHTRGQNEKADLLEKYRMHNVLNLLFPESFPAMHGVSDSDGLTIKGFIPTNKGNVHSLPVSTHIKDLEQKVFQATGFFPTLDQNPNNFLAGKNGKTYYVDFIMNSSKEFAEGLDPVRALTYFDEKFAKFKDTETFKAKRARLKLNIKQVGVLAAKKEKAKNFN
jgi:hypothetical protein